MTLKEYEIIKHELFQKDVKRLSKTVTRLEEFIKGAEKILSRKPEIGKKTNRNKVFSVPIRDLPGNPKVALYYCFSKDCIIFLMLRAEGDERPDYVFL